MASDITVLEEVRPRSVKPADRDGAWVPVALVAVIGFACGLSPLFSGFYSLSTWGVIALAMLAVTGGVVLGGQSGPTGRALVALIAVGALAGISLLSLSWAESVDDALTGADRWVLYASTFALLLVAMRTSGAGRLGIAAATAGVLVLAIYILAVMIGSDPASLFLGGRLNDPLGYANGEGLVLLLGMWPLIGWAQYARPLPA